MENTILSAIERLEQQVTFIKGRIKYLEGNGCSLKDTEHLRARMKRHKVELNELRFQQARG
ncbi:MULTISPECIES: hypothetical protein [unclassified Flammeovirga]|uniref:hypothetical protein n=1 Tax=unclassified Flammeovirga TaxID=2637820 RepID=UPI0005C44D41|nr:MULTISPECIES: hypothetical protein [unclassified Flammeovirga]MBD0400988.1 hypothetical protein [Flammeovirga sp. EKP202]